MTAPAETIHYAACEECGYESAATAEALYQHGPPLCPCNNRAMHCEQFDEMRAETEAIDQPRVLRDRYVTLQSHQNCDRCRIPLAHNEQARHRVITINGELHSTYTCYGCDGPQSQGGRRAMARADYAPASPIDLCATPWDRGRAMARKCAAKKTKSKRGGARPGAGRPRDPKTVPTRTIAFRVPVNLAKRVEERFPKTHQSLSAWAREVFVKALNRG